MQSSMGEDAVYIRVPEGLEAPRGHVMRLDRALEGAHQAGMKWDVCLRSFLVAIGFGAVKNAAETVYVKEAAAGDVMMVVVHIDDF
jgi:hypothetical protein